MGLGTYLWSQMITTASNTPVGSPLITPTPEGPIWIDSVEIRIPRGHLGTTGILLANSGTPLLPFAQSFTYLQGDDERLSFDLGVEVDTGLQFYTYNADVFSHSHLVRVSGRYMVVQSNVGDTSVPAPVPIS